MTVQFASVMYILRRRCIDWRSHFLYFCFCISAMRIARKSNSSELSNIFRLLISLALGLQNISEIDIGNLSGGGGAGYTTAPPLVVPRRRSSFPVNKMELYSCQRNKRKTPFDSYRLFAFQRSAFFRTRYRYRIIPISAMRFVYSTSLAWSFLYYLITIHHTITTIQTGSGSCALAVPTKWAPDRRCASCVTGRVTSRRNAMKARIDPYSIKIVGKDVDMLL